MTGHGSEVDNAELGRGSRRRSGELSGLILGVVRGQDRAVTPGEVSQLLRDDGSGELAYSTVVTILSRLHAQGLVERERAGRAYAYRAVADPARLAAGRMRRVLDGERDRSAVLASFVDDLSPGDEDLLRQLLGAEPTGGASPEQRK